MEEAIIVQGLIQKISHEGVTGKKWIFKYRTCKTTFRKQLFWRFCKPGTQNDLSFLFEVLRFDLRKDHGKLVSIGNLPSLIANTALTIPSKPATDRRNIESRAQFIWEKVGKPRLRLWSNVAKLTSPPIRILASRMLYWIHKNNQRRGKIED